MSISGASNCSTANCLAAYDAQLRQPSRNLDTNINEEKQPGKQTTEYILRGELIDEANEQNGFRAKKNQNIDPENQKAINSYEENSGDPTPVFASRMGEILDAYV
ncbi:MAG: hypothetical protein ISR69_08005 [Gammaproteobacteria bacterium]|nr:hypothetical protein [Gammaproteobacteria bacterium]